MPSTVRTHELCHLAEEQTLPHPTHKDLAGSSKCLWRQGGDPCPVRTPVPGLYTGVL